MRTWPQSSQASTWPPRAAVRQASIAAITLNWPRLRWPAWAARQAAPWRWKMSATSSDGRLTAAVSPVRPRLVLSRQPDPVEGAHDRADRGGGDAGIERGGLELGMAEQDLDDANVDVLLQQMRGEAVAQGVRRHLLADPGGLGRGVDGAVHLTGRQRRDRIAAREQPALRQPQATAASLPPPGPQELEQVRRQHGVAVLAALTLFDTDQHARAIDVAHLERDDLGDPQSGAIGRAERGPVLRPRCRFEQPRDLLKAEHQRQLARLADEREAAGEIGAVQRHGEEEAQRRDGAVDARRL